MTELAKKVSEAKDAHEGIQLQQEELKVALQGSGRTIQCQDQLNELDKGDFLSSAINLISLNVFQERLPRSWKRGFMKRQSIPRPSTGIKMN